MTRKAIIIGNNTGKNAPAYLSGVNHDLINYQAYLKSVAGGEWYQGEIEILHNLKKKEILEKVNHCGADYSFVVFTGHGFLNSNNNLTYACVEDDYISEDELSTKSYKKSLILDCCRQKEVLVESLSDGSRALTKSLSNKIENMATRQLIAINSRKKFDSALQNSSNGYFKGYSCSVDQTSGDNPSLGGLFSTELIKVGYAFGSVSNLHSETLSIKKTLLQVIANFENNRLTKEQTPTHKTNMELTPPFAITNLRYY